MESENEIVPVEAQKSAEIDLRNIEERARELSVTNREGYEKAVSLAVWNRDVMNKIEDLHRAIRKPYEDALKNIDKGFEKLLDPFTDMDGKLLGKMEIYSTRVELGKIKTVHVDGGRATVVERVTFEVIDESKVPRSMMMPDRTKIGGAVRAGLDVPGVKKVENRSITIVTQK
jgi:hypothetical protein